MINSLHSHTDLDDDHKKSWALVGMVAFGFGEVFGGIFMGIVVDKFGSKYASIKNAILAIVMLLITTICIHINNYNTMTFVMCFTWGYLDGALNIHTL